MNNEEWCRLAQDDQNLHRINHIYSNFRHSLRERIISTDGLECFRKALANFNLPSAVAGRSRQGDAELAVKQASQIHYAQGGDQNSDFRLAGTVINANMREVFVSVGLYPVSGPTATGALAPRPAPTLRQAKLKWVTTRTDVLAALSSAGVTGMSRLGFFKLLVAVLGLKSWAPRLVYTVHLFRLGSTDAIRRPHVFSGGYGDRFCGASTRTPFGGTADNRNGEEGLPEAIALETSLVPLHANSPEYVAFKSALSALAPWVGSVPLNQEVSAELDASAVHADDADYTTLKRAIVRRLGEPGNFCSTISSGTGAGCVAECSK